MPSEPLVPLRWYEHWLLRFLARSPRISRIVVFQTTTEDDTPPTDFIAQLEAAYRAPSPGE